MDRGFFDNGFHGPKSQESRRFFRLQSMPKLQGHLQEQRNCEAQPSEPINADLSQRSDNGQQPKPVHQRSQKLHKQLHPNCKQKQTLNPKPKRSRSSKSKMLILRALLVEASLLRFPRLRKTTMPNTAVVSLPGLNWSQIVGSRV